MFKLSRLAGRILAAAALAAALLVPGMAYADEAVSFGGEDVAAKDQVYLGSWESAPILWDVESAGGSLAVHSHYILFDAQIHKNARVAEVGELTLETSELYTSRLPEFKNDAFSDSERALTGGFALSGNFGGATRPDSSDQRYWINEPLIKRLWSDEDWWFGAVVHPSGGRGTYHVDNKYGVRPASSFDLTSVLFASASEGGKSGAAGAGNFAALSAASSVSAWKFTLLDSSRAVTASASGTTAQPGYASWTVPVTFSGGGTGSSDYVSAILCDADGNAIYYGTVAASKASGTQDMAMPDGLAEGTYTLKVFSEQRNGDKATDYAGAFVDIGLTVEPAPAEHTVRFVDEDGTEISTATYAEGTAAADVVKPADPTKPPTAQYTYEFAGWDPAVADVTGDATYTATYEATPVPKPAEKATLAFDLAGGTLDGKTGSITVEASVGDTVKLPAAPTREGYTFKYWMGSEYAAGADYVVPEGGHEFTAEWEKNDSGAPSDTKPAIPATGDGSAMLVMVLSVAALGSLLVLAGCATRRRAYRGKHSR